MYIKAKHFRIEELCPREIIQKYKKEYGGIERCWQFFDPRAIIGLDWVRDFFDKPVTVNNWLWGGELNYRGFRPITCTVGSDESQHRLGRGWDLNVKGLTAEEVKDAILGADPGEHHITYMEWFDGMTWTHIDYRNSPFEGVHVFKP